MTTQNITTPEPVTREAFFALFDPSVHAQLAATLDRPATLGIVCFTNLQLDSSECGRRSALIYGKGCTYETLAAVASGRLGDVPSRFQYPTHYFVKSVDGQPALV